MTMDSLLIHEILCVVSKQADIIMIVVSSASLYMSDELVHEHQADKNLRPAVCTQHELSTSKTTYCINKSDFLKDKSTTAAFCH